MLAYERFGQGAPLLLVHGLGHRRQAWYPIVDLLTPHREVILVDLPGHGESPGYEPNGRMARDYLRDEFVAFNEHLNLGRPHVAGYSLGGLIALESAVEQRASSVTALSPAGFWRGDGDFAYVERIFKSVVALAGVSRHVAPVLARSKAGRALMYSWLMAHPSRIDSKAAVDDLSALIHARPAVRSLLAEAYTFDRPLPEDTAVTIAWSKKDRVLRSYQGDRAREQLPAATHLWLQGCGHVPMSDEPSLIADVILQASSGPLLSDGDSLATAS